MVKRVRRLKSTPAEVLGFLIRSHYLSEDFPGVITTDKFAEFCVDHYDTLESVKALLGRVNYYGTFSAPRTTTARRVLALPHPTSQLALSLIIATNIDEIRKVIERSKITLYKTNSSVRDGRAFIGIDFKSRAEREAQILAGCPVILKADISNFFRTIYTHSLPWAVLGKEWVKDTIEGSDGAKKKTLAGHWADQIDRALQRGNSKETFGIPIGPDTSRIIAEILLSGIHKDKVFGPIVERGMACRLVDDFFIGFEDEASAQKCLDALRRALWDYNLHLNEDKTGIIRSCELFGSGWEYEIDSFPVPDGTDAAAQKKAVRHLVELSLHHCKDRKDARPATFLCNRLLKVEIADTNFSYVRDCIFRISRDFTVCLKFAAEFVYSNRKRLGEEDSLEVVNKWAKHVLGAHSRRGHDSEISWVLVICGILGLKVGKSFIGVEEPVVSAVVLALLGLLSEKGLLEEDWDYWNSPPEGSGPIANGRNWLPHYEAVHRKWTKDAKIIAAIKADPLFASLLKAKITFLDDAAFLGAREDELRLQRTRRAGKKNGTAIPRAVLVSRQRISRYD